MESVLIAVLAFVGYIVAYKTYGKYLARRIFNLDCDRPTAAVELEDGRDFVPTRREILFGHHYTSIAGTGPIVGPAIGIIWGWVPALLWVVLGSIFMGAVHDFGAVVVSMRNKGRSVGDLAADYISPRVRMMFLGIVFLLLMVVIAIFCLVIASVFDLYPECVFAIWCEIPIALMLGYLLYRRKGSMLLFSAAALALMYVTVVVGAYFKLSMPRIGPVGPLVSWTVVLLIYAYVASVLPVWRLLQPRDYMNGLELFVAMALLALGTILAHPQMVAPAIDTSPAGAPPIFPFLFITIACGAISGFHSLVGSGTTSKQIRREEDACIIGYGSMLTEGMLAVFVVVAVAGGIGLGTKTLVWKEGKGEQKAGWVYAEKAPELVEAGAKTKEVTGSGLWSHHYRSWAAAKGLGSKVEAFVDGSANMLERVGIPAAIALAIMGVFVSSFAATTLDTATRLQRYVVSEFGKASKLRPLENRHVATLIAVLTAGLLALADFKNPGKGGLILWPLFGAGNQLLACLALLVVTTYLKKKGKPIRFTLIPAAIMFVITGWAMACNLGQFYKGGLSQLHLFVISIIVIVLELWMVVEAVKVLTTKAGSGQGDAGGKAPASV